MVSQSISSEICRRNELIALGGSGTCFTVAGQAFKAKENQRVFHAKGMAAMGFGIPSSIGVAVAHKGRRVLTIVGDGGFQLNMQELQTISQRNLPIKIFVIQNDGYHAIRVTQDTYFNKKYIGSSKEFGVRPKESLIHIILNILLLKKINHFQI